jgi:hypothetical protein
MSVVLETLFIMYIVVGSYCAGVTADDLRSAGNESIIRILSWIFGWPYKIYTDLRDWRPDSD